MGSEYATGGEPNSALNSPTGGMGGASDVAGSMAGMLSPRGGLLRSPSQVRMRSLGFQGGRRGKGGAKGLVRVAVDGVREWVGETGELMGLWKGERTRRF